MNREPQPPTARTDQLSSSSPRRRECGRDGVMESGTFEGRRQAQSPHPSTTPPLHLPFRGRLRGQAGALVVVTGWLLAILLLSTVLPARAQLGDMIYTVGTSRPDGGGRQWAYVLWQASSPEQIAGRFFAVYAK